MARTEDKTSDQPDKTGMPAKTRHDPAKTRHDQLDAPLPAGLEGEAADPDADNVDAQVQRSGDS